MSFTTVKNSQEIDAMRHSGRMLATVLARLEKVIAPGMTTKDLALVAAKELKALGGEPAFLGYQGFPDVLCVSINDEVVHGIPKKDRILSTGDIVSLDFGVKYKGMITDSAISLILGRPKDDQAVKLVEATRQSLYDGINQVKNRCKVGDISSSVQKRLDKDHLGIVRDLVGHGVGHQLHEDPNIPNFGPRNTGPELLSGMTVAIEPMATLGRAEVYFSQDGWTVLTQDKSLAAHFEHTVLVTDQDAEILTELSKD